MRNVFRQSDLLDLEPTPAYSFRFLKDGLFGARGRSSVGRALEWHSRGQGFDSPRLHCAASCGAVDGQPVRSVMQRTSEGTDDHAGIAQLVEHNLAKVGVAGSSPVSRSDITSRTSRVSRKGG